MTTAILAHDYSTAESAARNLGLSRGTWVYPVRASVLHLRTITRVVYVEGWQLSPVLAPAVLQLIAPRLAQWMPIEEIEQPVTRSVIFGLLDADAATAELARQRARKVLAAPFVDPGQFRPTAHRRLSWFARLLRRLRLA